MTLSTEAKYEERNATIEIQFDENLNMESMDISAKYAIGEILQKAGLNTVLGMGTVFAVLIFLAFIISLMKYIPMLLGQTKKQEDAVKEVKRSNPVMDSAASDEIDDCEAMDDTAFDQFINGSDLQVNLTMMQIGLPIEKDALVSMINAWKASIDECGAYKEHGEFEAEADKKTE